MNIIVKKNYLYIDQFKLKCAVGKGGITSNKIEGDGCTPKGKYQIGKIYYRKDRVSKPMVSLDKIIIRKDSGWCDDPDSIFYNKRIKIKKNNNFKFEKLYRSDSKYNYIILIEYNYLKPKKNKGSAIFIHLTKNYKPTKGCVVLKEKDFFILCKLINRESKILIT